MIKISRIEYVASLRYDEWHFRRTGRYDAAVSTQRRADIIEATGEYPAYYEYLDRGFSEPLECYLEDASTLVIPSTNDAVAIALTKDRVPSLITQLLVFSDLTPDEVDELAIEYRWFREKKE